MSVRRFASFAVAIGLLVGLVPVLSPAAQAAVTPPSDGRQGDAPASTGKTPPPATDPVEVLSLRTAQSNTFRVGEDYRTVLSAGPVNFKDQAGQWQHIDTTLIDGPDGTVHPKSSPVDVSLPRDLSQPITINSAAGPLSFAWPAGSSARRTTEGNQARYQPSAAVAVEYTAAADRLKETITLASAAAPSSFEFTVNPARGSSLRDAAGGGIDIVGADGKAAMRFAAPVVLDSSTTEAGNPPKAVAMHARQGDGGTWSVTVTVDEAWLSSPARVWPVVIDPVVVINTEPLGGTACGLQEHDIWSCNLTLLPVGFNGTDRKRSLVQFDTTSIPRDAIVLDADLALHAASALNSTPIKIGAHRVSTAWDWSGATWDHYDTGMAQTWTASGGDFDAATSWDTAGIATTGQWYHWHPLQTVKNFIAGSVANNGFMMTSATEATTAVVRFDSYQGSTASVYPSLTVVWDTHYSTAPSTTNVDLSLGDGMALHANVATGNLQLATNDLAIAGMARTFNSRRAAVGNGMGPGWTANYSPDVFLRRQVQGLNFRSPGGEPFLFKSLPDGTAGWTSPPGINADIATDGTDAYKITFHASQEVWRFAAASGDEVAHLTSITDRNGQATTYAYSSTLVGDNNEPALQTVTDNQGRVFTATTASGHMTRMTDNTSRHVDYSYTSGLLTTYTDAAGAQTTYAYDAGGRVSQITDPLGHVTKLAYDTDGRVTSIIRVTNGTTGPTWTFTYHIFAWDTTITPHLYTATNDVQDPNGHTTTYKYDTDDQFVRVIDALGNTQTNTYTANADIAKVTDAMAAATTHRYDTTYNIPCSNTGGPYTLNNPSEVQAPDVGLLSGRSSSRCYPTPVSAGGGTFTAVSYLPTSGTDEEGAITQYGYDSAGNLQTVTDANSAVATTHHNSDGTVSDKTDPGGSCASIPKVHCTTYTYTYASSPPTLSQVVIDRPSPLGDVTTTYDTLGRATTSTVAGGPGTIRYTYDNLDRNTQVLYAGATTCTSGSASCLEYGYDTDGNLTSRTDNTGTTTWGYDKLNQPWTKTAGSTTCTVTLPDSSTLTGTTCATYDAAGNVGAYTDAGGTVTYAYDAANRATSVVEPGGTVPAACSIVNNDPSAPTKTPASKCSAFAYNENGFRKYALYPSGQLNTVIPDVSGRVGSVTANTSARGNFISRTYTYDNATGGDAALLHTTTDSIASKTMTYGYNNLNRLTSADDSSTGGAADYQYTYDDPGNRTQTVNSGTTTNYKYNDAEQLCNSVVTSAANCTTPLSTSTVYTYDVDGNQLTSSINSVAKFAGAYNAKDQSTSLTAATGGTATTFAYADAGQAERATSTYSGTTTNMLNGLMGLSATTVSGGATLYFTRDPNGGLVSMRDGAGSTGINSYYYTFGQLGSVINMTGPNTTGADVANYSYDPYGALISAAPTGVAASNPWRFAAGYHDTNTGLVVFGDRYYDPTIGRWTQLDPSGADRGYTYVHNDPTNSTDPSGRQGLSPGCGPSGAYQDIANCTTSDDPTPANMTWGGQPQKSPEVDTTVKAVQTVLRTKFARDFRSGCARTLITGRAEGAAGGPLKMLAACAGEGLVNAFWNINNG